MYEPTSLTNKYLTEIDVTLGSDGPDGYNWNFKQADGDQTPFDF